LFNLSTAGGATPQPRPTEEIMRGNQAKEWDGQWESKDNMEAFKILKSTTSTNTFSVMSLDVVLALLKDAAVFLCYTISRQM